MKINMINDSGMDVSEDLLSHWIKNIATELQKKKIIRSEEKAQEVSLVFLNENDAKKLNWNYRCKDYPTDILSFNSDDPTSMGELVLCPQVISRQAKEHGLSLEDELGYIVLHGVLHLLGYDHEKSKVDEELMMSIQDEIFDNIRNPKGAKKAKLSTAGGNKKLTVKKVIATAGKPIKDVTVAKAEAPAVRTATKVKSEANSKSKLKSKTKSAPTKSKKKK